MLRLSLLIMLWLPAVVLAASGGWSASGTGAALSLRGVQASSPALSPPAPVEGVMTEVHWRYLLSGPTPAGMQVRLCSSTRCAAIEGGSGSTRGLTNVPASESLRFVFYVEGKGRLFPVLRVLSNQVMVNYQG